MSSISNNVSHVGQTKSDAVLCVPGLVFGPVSGPHPASPLLLFFLFVEQPIVESHSCKQEEAGDDEEDPTALVSVSVIMVDVFEPPCEDKTVKYAIVVIMLLNHFSSCIK